MKQKDENSFSVYGLRFPGFLVKNTDRNVYGGQIALLFYRICMEKEKQGRMESRTKRSDTCKQES